MITMLPILHTSTYCNTHHIHRRNKKKHNQTKRISGIVYQRSYYKMFMLNCKHNFENKTKCNSLLFKKKENKKLLCWMSLPFSNGKNVVFLKTINITPMHVWYLDHSYCRKRCNLNSQYHEVICNNHKKKKH